MKVKCCTTSCTSDCQSSLRALRAAATHFPQLRRFLHLLYEGIRQHRLLESIDTALCTGDFEKLSKLCAISYCKPLSSKGSSDDSCGAADSVAKGSTCTASLSNIFIIVRLPIANY